MNEVLKKLIVIMGGAPESRSVGSIINVRV
jgi:hypothetical protein